MTRLMRHPLARSLNEFEREINRILTGGAELGNNVEASEWLPALDIKEEKDHFLIRADVPGIEPNNIDISMDNNILTIRGERESEHKEQRENFLRFEREKGGFYRRVSLPDTVDAEKIKAKCKNGVLEIMLPKKAQSIARKIAVEGVKQ